MDFQLLEDFNFIEKYELVESKLPSKHILRGVFSRADIPNKNKRVYPRSVLESCINEAQPIVGQRGLVGELDHPPTPKINIRGISHIITKLAMAPDGAVLGEIEALDTDPGQQLKKLMEAHVRLGVSTRGLGSVKPYSGPLGEGLVEVAPGYRMKAIDIVFDPSADTFPEAVVEETSDGNIVLGSTIDFRKVWQEVFGNAKL